MSLNEMPLLLMVGDVLNSDFKLQVAIWRDSRRRRLVIAFRGTEQVGYSLIYVQMFSIIYFKFL